MYDKNLTLNNLSETALTFSVDYGKPYIVCNLYEHIGYIFASTYKRNKLPSVRLLYNV